MARVIIVSNRLPINVSRVDGELVFGRSVGGLATGLASYVNSSTNRWIGWPGMASDGLTEAEVRQIRRELAKHNCVPVFLTQKQLDDFYAGYSNSILWPLFHNLPVNADGNRESWWRGYRGVNQAFAEATSPYVKRNSQIWVHDYLLMLLPSYLRRDHPTTNIGFFLHIPFPAAKSFVRLPEAKRLIQGVLGADLVGFHTPSYVSNFLKNCQELGIGTPGQQQITLGTRSIRVTDFPIGIDYEKYASASKLPEVKKAVRQMRRKYRGKKVIASAERLDISKGYVERLQAYREFLSTHPKLHGKIVFVLVGAPSRSDLAAYKKLAADVETLARDINQEFGSSKWQPLEYIHDILSFEQVSALFQVADVSFVAPLRDGMNLTPKEFIASKRSSGVVILSDTAGAAEELHDALLVSHQRPESLVNALDQALNMRPREIRQRLKRMQKQVSSNTIHTWAGSFMTTLQQPRSHASVPTRPLSTAREFELLSAYRAGKQQLILLDYDGTLVPLENNFAEVEPPKSVLGKLEKLSRDPANTVVLISGRTQHDLQAWFGHLPINLVAEHGAAVKQVGNKSWRDTVETGKRWKRIVRPVLHEYTALTPGAKIEEKQFSLVWHYRQASPYYAQKNLVIIQRILKPLLKPYKVALFNGSKILEIKDPAINKGRAIERWLKRPHDFILALGDDLTDEDTFVALPPEAYSIKVGRGRTKAHYRLKAVADVQTLLKALTK